jgi:hypothetical protein
LFAGSIPFTTAVLPELKKNLTAGSCFINQKDLSGGGTGIQWLRVPDGPIYLVMRLYWPEEAALRPLF